MRARFCRSEAVHGSRRTGAENGCRKVDRLWLLFLRRLDVFFLGGGPRFRMINERRGEGPRTRW